MNNPYIAKRGNKIVRIDENSIERYKGAGYIITDESGKVVTVGTPHNMNQLSSAYQKLAGEVETYKAEIERLKNENAKLLAEINKFKSAPISEPQKQTRKRKQTTSDEEVTE